MRNKNDRLDLTYEIEDGYSGGARPQHTSIEYSEIHDCESVEDAMRLVEDYIQQDFEQKAYPAFDYHEIQKQVEEIWGNRPKEDSNEQ